jgi:hypothetical protein
MEIKMTTELRLEDPRDTLKAIRETLCIAQARIGNSGIDSHRIESDVARIGRIIAEIDRQRPLGSDGKHGDLHTPTCGCEDARP